MELKTPRFWRVAWFLELTRACRRVRARAAYKLRVCVQYGDRESASSESPPPAFPCFSGPEMNARPKAADSEGEFKAPSSDVPFTYRKRHQNVTISRADRPHHPLWRSDWCGCSRLGQGQFESRWVRVIDDRVGRRGSLVCFVRELDLALSLAPLISAGTTGNKQAAIAGLGHGRCRVQGNLLFWDGHLTQFTMRL